MAGTIVTIIGIAISVCIIVALIVFDVWDMIDTIKAVFKKTERSRLSAKNAYQAFPQLREHYNNDQLEKIRTLLSENLDKLYLLHNTNDAAKEECEKFINDNYDQIIALVKSLHNIEKNSSDVIIEKAVKSGFETLQGINFELERLITKHSVD